MYNQQKYTGLTDVEVADSRCEHGFNVFMPPKMTSLCHCTSCHCNGRRYKMYLLFPSACEDVGGSLLTGLLRHEKSKAFKDPVVTFLIRYDK